MSSGRKPAAHEDEHEVCGAPSDEGPQTEDEAHSFRVGAAANLDICREVSHIRDPAFEGRPGGRVLPALPCDWLSHPGGWQGAPSPLTREPKRRAGQLSLLATGRCKGCSRLSRGGFRSALTCLSVTARSRAGQQQVLSLPLW